jgi:hypothetical protein
MKNTFIHKYGGLHEVLYVRPTRVIKHDGKNAYNATINGNMGLRKVCDLDEDIMPSIYLQLL